MFPIYIFHVYGVCNSQQRDNIIAALSWFEKALKMCLSLWTSWIVMTDPVL